MRAAAICGLASVWFYFAVLAKDALGSYFDPDACMNLSRSWAPPLSELIKANVLFFDNSSFYRPFASAWYRVIYAAAGFNPVPFNAMTLLILAANIWLTYALCRRLAGSREVGVMAALLIAYHSNFAALYFDLGFIYDVLVYFFYFGALLYYVRIRAQQRGLRVLELIAFGVLYVCALNSKEIAVTLPAAIAAYEWLYHAPPVSVWKRFRHWLFDDGRALLVASVMMVVFAVGRSIGNESLLAMKAYRPVFSWQQFMTSSVSFINSLIFRPNSPVLGSVPVLLIWLALFAIAWSSRLRVFKFAWLFLMFSPIPVVFLVPVRGAEQYYVPLFGWVLYAAAALVQGTRYLSARMAGRTRLEFARPIIVFAATGVCLYVLNIQTGGWDDVATVSREGELMRSVVDQVHRLRPALRKGARILFIDDPFDVSYRMQILIGMSYRDRDLVVDSARFMTKAPDAAQIAAYDCVFDDHLGTIQASVRPPALGAEPTVVASWGHPEFYRSDWTPIMPGRHVARRGEIVISKVTDLGDTDPALAPGQEFPQNPLAQVTTPIEVRVDGQPVEVVVKIGWPGTVNRYRLDFRMPSTVRHSLAPVQIARRGGTGPVALIAVE